MTVTASADALRARPNILMILTDDQQMTALGASGNREIHTPNMDALAAEGIRFTNANVVFSLCSPSRAAVMTGRYGSANGVSFLAGHMNKGEETFANYLRDAGYRTGMSGKWHVKNTPAECGFDFSARFEGNGRYHGRPVTENGKTVRPNKHVDEYCVDRSIAFLEQAAKGDAPFVLFHCSQLPHMDHRHSWPAKGETLSRYEVARMPLPVTWQDDLSGKPPYLKTVRNRTQALKYGYDNPENIRRHARDYYAVITELDQAIGRLLAALDRLALRETTYVFFMSDNGWMLGDHGFTSKVLHYEASMRVPFVVRGPGLPTETDDHLVLNVDLAPTFLDLSGVPVPANMHGRSLTPLLRREKPNNWRDSFVYEALGTYGGTRPMLAARTPRWKYTQTYAPDDSTKIEFEELYDLQIDPDEMQNLADDPLFANRKRALAEVILRHRQQVLAP